MPSQLAKEVTRLNGFSSKTGKASILKINSYHWSLSILPKKIRKPEVFRVFNGI